MRIHKNTLMKKIAALLALTLIIQSPPSYPMLRAADLYWDANGISLGNSGNDLVLNFTAAASVALTWSPVGGTSWNTGVAANWLNGGSRTTFGTNNNVTLGDTGVGNVSVDAAGVTPGTVTVANTSGTYTFTGGAIGGSGPLTKNSAGTLLLQNTNSYSGSTIINGGIVQLGVANALPTATGVTLSNTTGALLNLANNNQTIGSLSGGGNSGGNVALGSGTLTVGDGSSTSFDGILSGAGGSLIKQGAGTLLLGNTSSYTGSTTINAGTLRSGTANASPGINPREFAEKWEALALTPPDANGHRRLLAASDNDFPTSRLHIGGRDIEFARAQRHLSMQVLLFDVVLSPPAVVLPGQKSH